MHRRIGVVAGLICLSSFSSAQEEIYQLAPITVTGKIEPPGAPLESQAETGSRLGITIKETPASVEVLPGDAVRERGDLSTQSAVARATGITPAGAPGDGSTALVARGFYGPNSVMQLYDGTRLYVAAATITFPVDTWVLDRVEVLRGPASVLYGEGAIGGATNFVPRQPNRKGQSVDLLAGAGSFHTYRLGAAATGPLSDRAAYQIAAISTKSKGFVDRGESERVSLASSLVFDVTNDFSLKFSLDGTVNEPDRYFGTPLVNGGIDSRLREKNYNVDDSAIRYKDYWGRLQANWRITPTVSLRNELYSLNADRHWRNVEGIEFLPASNEVLRQFYIEIFHDMRQVGNRVDLAVSEDLFGHRNRFLVGVDWNKVGFQRDSNSPFSGTSTVDAFDVSPGRFLEDDSTVPEFKSRITQYALFSENAFDLTDSFKAVAGLRYEKIDFTRDDLVSGGRFDKDFDPFTWRLGGVYKLNTSATLYAQVSRGVEALGDLVTLGLGERDFDLTEARQYEVGMKSQFLHGRGETSLAFYDIVKKGLLTPDPTNPGSVIPVGKQSSRGVEATLRWAVTPKFGIDANVAVLRAQFDEFQENVAGTLVSRKGNQPVNVPEHAANLWVTHTANVQWRTGIGARYVGKRFADTANTIAIPSYTVVDAFVRYAPKPWLSFSLHGRNLGDRDYAIASYYTNTQFILGEPRAFELVAEARF